VGVRSYRANVNMGKKATYSILYLIMIDRKKIEKLDGKQAELRSFFISLKVLSSEMDPAEIRLIR
jgi:hypothetical protein